MKEKVKVRVVKLDGPGTNGDEATRTSKIAKGDAYAVAPIVTRFPNAQPAPGLKVELYASKDHLQSKDFHVVATAPKG